MLSRYFLLLSPFMFLACVTPSSVVKSVSSPTEAVIEVDKAADLKGGDAVEVFRLKCQVVNRSPRLGGGTSKTCHETLVGQGQIVRMNSDTEATISLAGDAVLETGMVVKKKK